MVRRVGGRIASAITTFYNQKGQGSELSGYNWEFNLVDNKQVNAWCMPGGKMVVYSGLLPVAQNEAALAIALIILHSSLSIAITDAAPDFSARMASIAVPVPRSKKLFFY